MLLNHSQNRSCPHCTLLLRIALPLGLSLSQEGFWRTHTQWNIKCPSLHLAVLLRQVIITVKRFYNSSPLTYITYNKPCMIWLLYTAAQKTYTKFDIGHDNKHERYDIWCQTLSLYKKQQHFKCIINFLHDKITWIPNSESDFFFKIR